MTQPQAKLFQKTIRDYFRLHRRQLPWRCLETDGFDPYKILVSEMMLQQTQVIRVIPKFQAFLQQFPNLPTLARASLADVLIVWNGLGYNRRAKYLHDAAKQLAPRRQPWKLEDLNECKGIGQNTAAACIVYTYNQPLVFVETNIRTVYIHHFFPKSADINDKEILLLLEQTLDRKNPREFYWALMDYGTHLKNTIGNTAIRSRHYSKQSPFEGSRRQIRGQILRELSKTSLTSGGLGLIIKDKRLSNVLRDLEIEQLITRSNLYYSLAS